MANAKTAGEVTQHDVEQFLYEEAALLDGWKLNEWLGLLTEDIEYVVPATNLPGGSPATALYIVADDMVRLRSRTTQLLEGQVLVENPRSRTRRLVSNVRILGRTDTTLEITANFAVYRAKHEQVHVFMGRYDHELVVTDGGLKIRRRTCTLDLEALRPHSAMTFIL